MAVPALTANSPSAGFITWAGFNIQYNGVPYTVATGNTNLTYTAWLYNGGTPQIKSSNVLPVESGTTDGSPANWPAAPDIGPNDLLLFINRSGVPLNIQASSLLDGDLIVTGTVTSNAIATNTIVAGNIAANTITASQIATDTITANQIAANAIGTSELSANAVIADKIAAGAVTTAKLTVGSLGSNHIMNAAFEDVDSSNVLTSWRNNFLGGTAAVGNSTSTFIDGARSGLVTPTATASGDITSAAFPVVAGQTLYVTGYFAVGTANIPAGITVTFGATQAYTTASLVAGTPTTKNIGLARIDTGAALTPTAATTSAGRANLFGGGFAIATANVIHQFGGQVVIPTGASWASVSLQGFSGVAGNIYWDDVECDSIIISAVIGDGAVTANTISANAVTASKIAATAIDGKIITGAVIRAGFLSAPQLAGSQNLRSSKNLANYNPGAKALTTDVVAYNMATGDAGSNWYLISSNGTGGGAFNGSTVGNATTGTVSGAAQDFKYQAAADAARTTLAGVYYRYGPAYILVPGIAYTLSFDAKVTSGSTGWTVQIGRDGTAGSSRSDLLAPTTITGLSSTWQRFTYTFTVPSALTLGPLRYLYFLQSSPAVASTFEVTGVQIEEGSSATTYTEGWSGFFLDDDGGIAFGGGNGRNSSFWYRGAYDADGTNMQNQGDLVVRSKLWVDTTHGGDVLLADTTGSGVSNRRSVPRGLITTTRVTATTAQASDLTMTSMTAPISENDGTASSVTWQTYADVVAGRRYLITSLMSLGSSAGSITSATRLITTGSTSAGTAKGPCFGQTNVWHGVARFYTHSAGGWYNCTTSGTLVMTAQYMLVTGSATISIGQDSFVMVEDMGVGY